MLITETPIAPGLYDVHWTFSGIGEAVVSIEGEWAIDTAISGHAGVLRVHVDELLTVEVQRYDTLPFSLSVRAEAVGVPEPQGASLLAVVLVLGVLARRWARR